MNFSTINLEALRKLPTYTLPPTYSLQHGGTGNGCAGDAPGFPTYFTRSVYTAHGNSPRRGPQLVIVYEGKIYVVAHSDDWKKGDTWERVRARQDARLRRLWSPLPIDHVRVRAWIRETYRHHARCYVDDSRPWSATSSDHTVIWPVPSYKLQHFADDPRFSDDWRAREKARVEDANREIIAYARRIVIPENHLAVRRIREFYPEYAPDLELIASPPAEVGGQWWETEAERPAPEACKPRSVGSHPVNGSWCQWCGWRAEDEVAVEVDTHGQPMWSSDDPDEGGDGPAAE